MSLKFTFAGYRWSLRSGFPPAGSTEHAELKILDALKIAHPPLAKLTTHEIASWIVARLHYITATAIDSEGKEFSHDTDEFGYKIRIVDDSDSTLAHGAVVFQATGIYFAAIEIESVDLQAIFVTLLAHAPDDLGKCQFVVQVPEQKKKRLYGWNGHALLSD